MSVSEHASGIVQPKRCFKARASISIFVRFHSPQLNFILATTALHAMLGVPKAACDALQRHWHSPARNPWRHLALRGHNEDVLLLFLGF